MRLFLVRHGESQENVDGIVQGDKVDGPLSPRGEKQAEALAHHFAVARARGLRVDAVWSSPLRRAQQTAEAIRVAIEAPEFRILPGLREISWGPLMGTPSKDAKALHDTLAAWDAGDISRAVEGGESPGEVWARAWADLQPLLHRDRNDTIVIVAHGRLNKILLSMLVGKDLRTMEAFPQANAAYTLLRRESSGDWSVSERNATQHLSGIPTLQERVS